jgi:hypothetical protein
VTDTLTFLLKKHGLENTTGPLPIPLRNTVRADLGPLFRELGFRRGAEIGVWRGDFSVELCRANPELHMLCVDPWTAYKEYIDHTRHDLIAGAYESAKKALAPYNATIVRQFSAEAVKGVPDESLDFVYIDGNHSFLDVVQDLEWWSRKVRLGGIVAGHDYKTFRPSLNLHVVEAVHGFTQAHYIAPWFVLGRSKTRRGERRDKERSFLWTREHRDKDASEKLGTALERWGGYFGPQVL